MKNFGVRNDEVRKNADAYTALKNNTANYYLPDNWQIGKCTVLAGDNSTITE